MPRLFTSLRLPLLALGLSLALTSCFEKCKKDDPKPKETSATNASKGGWCGTSSPGN